MINYPNQKKEGTNNNKNDNSSNRGMSLEQDLDYTNKYYLHHNIANIHKKPTPIQIVKVDYPKRQAAKITEAYFKLPSTTDYNGIYQGKYLDFEAKETRNKTKFIFTNIHKHQIEHLKSVIYHGGIAFFIIKFTSFNEVYLLSAQIVIDAINSGAKSLSYDIINAEGFLIKQGYQPRLDYLKAIDQLINLR
ncbi:Holliday junction resolvase RecU [Erysipelotrichaceae bacterium OttesenSCG-928-M19]|nr:Holliday junction resolvase RecU [Erysipelotrichaceae bacterium OttesenSCG-928-M19]